MCTYCGWDLDWMRGIFFNRSRINIEIHLVEAMEVAEMEEPVAHLKTSPSACFTRV